MAEIQGIWGAWGNVLRMNGGTCSTKCSGDCFRMDYCDGRERGMLPPLVGRARMEVRERLDALRVSSREERI